MKASLSAHILVKLGGPIVLFFILVLVSDFHYLVSALTKGDMDRLRASSQEALQIVAPDMRREKNFIGRLVDEASDNKAPDETSLDAALDELYLDLGDSIQTIKQLFILYRADDNQAPAFYCVNYLFSIIQEKGKISTRAIYDDDRRCHADIKGAIAAAGGADQTRPFWARLKTFENTHAFLIYPLRENAARDGFVVAEIFAEEIYDAVRMSGSRSNAQTRVLIESGKRFYALPEQQESHRIGKAAKSARATKGVGAQLDYESPVRLDQALEIRDPLLREPVHLARQALPLPGLYIERYRPTGDLFQFIYSIKKVSIVFSALGLLVLLVIVFIGGRNLSRPIKKLAAQAHAISTEQGHFQAPKKQLPKEIIRLAEALESMLGALKKRTGELVRASADKERMRAELKIANTIQMRLLPQQFDRLGEDRDFEIYALSQAARETGGDIYDFFPLDKTRTGVLVADVSGKGIPSALLMTMAKIIIKTIAKEKNGGAARCLEKVNNILMRENTSAMFITAFYGILDTEKKRLEYAVAGHNPPLLIHADGAAHYLGFDGGLALSVMEDATYSNHSLDFAMGDSLLIYTDGLTEAENSDERAYGESRLRKLASQNCRLSARRQIDEIAAALKSHTVGQAAFDDITMLCLRHCGNHEYHKVGQWDVRPDQREAAKALGEFNDACRRAALAEAVSHDLCLALDELISNSLRHRRHKENQGPITVIMKKRSDSVQLVYKEPGEAFDMRKSKQARIDLGWRERKPGGLGLHLIKQLFDDIAYRRHEGRNVLTLTKITAKNP